MASEVEIANIGLTLLGSSRILSLEDDVKAAREIKAVFAHCRDSLLGGYTWSFAKTRAQLPALADAPAFEYSLKYQLPANPYCLRLVQVGDYYVGIDLTDYRGSNTEVFTIEGREILTNLSAPLNIKYVKRVTDSTQFSPSFVTALGAKLATYVCEALTQSETKRDRAELQFQREISLAIRANAIELPPQKLADDEWMVARL